MEKKKGKKKIMTKNSIFKKKNGKKIKKKGH